MDDKEVLGRINELAREEHELFERESHGKVTDADRTRLRRLEVTLDQCWDLLRQRRARRAAGLNPDDAQVRSYLALGLAKTGKLSEAREQLRRALPPGPDRPELLFNAAIVANRGGAPAEAVAYLGRALKAGFNPAIIRSEPELANLKNRDDFEVVLRQHPGAPSR